MYINFQCRTLSLKKSKKWFILSNDQQVGYTKTYWFILQTKIFYNHILKTGYYGDFLII